MQEPIKIIPLMENRTQVWSQGVEQYAVRLTLDLTPFISAWPDGQPAVAFERADGVKYAHAFEVAGDTLHVPLLYADTVVHGLCKLTVAWKTGDAEARTALYYGQIRQTITSLGETPGEPEQGIIEQVNAAALSAEGFAKRAEEAAKRAEAAEGGGVAFEVDETLTLENGILSVNTADVVEEDNTLPVTSAAVNTTVGNINILLSTI